MSILPDHLITLLCAPTDEDGEPLITPFDYQRVQPASYDMTLGNEFVLFDDVKHLYSVIDLADAPVNIGNKVHIADGDPVSIDPGEFLLGVTRERLHCPADIAAKLDGKSSLARFGLLIHVTGGFVDPGFRGPLTLEIYNVFPIPIILRPGLPFCQVGFQKLTQSASIPYNGRYQDAQGVEASKYDGR